MVHEHGRLSGSDEANPSAGMCYTSCTEVDIVVQPSQYESCVDACSLPRASHWYQMAVKLPGYV